MSLPTLPALRTLPTVPSLRPLPPLPIALSSSTGLLLRAAIAAGIACAAILLVGRQQIESRLRLPDGVSTEIAIEHASRSAPELSIGNLRSTARIAILNTDEDMMAVSVPESWTRVEVTGALLKDVRNDAPAFGFVRWTLPRGATVIFESKDRIDHLEVYNPSGVPMQLRLRRTDILSGKAEEDTMLIQESPSTLF